MLPEKLRGFFSKNGFIKNSVEQSQKERGAM